jgi:hypothetical protein
MCLADKFDRVILPVGSPAFMFQFALELGLNNDPLCLDRYYFAHSVKESVEAAQADGSVKKTSVFKHVRFFNLRAAA